MARAVLAIASMAVVALCPARADETEAEGSKIRVFGHLGQEQAKHLAYTLPVPELEASEEADRLLESSVSGEAQNGVRSVEEFIERYPNSQWRPAFELNLGKKYYRDGYFTKALVHFQNVYGLLKDAQSANGRRQAAEAAAELSQMYARLGRMEGLAPLLQEALAKEPGGAARQILESSKLSLDIMTHQPGIAFKCGPLALAKVREKSGLEPAFHPIIQEARSPWRGFSLAELVEMARGMDMNYVAVKAPENLTDIPVPSVVHWKQDHYAAIVGKTESGRYVVKDLTFDFDGEIELAALQQECSGYLLVANDAVPEGWRKIDEVEAWEVFGRGLVSGVAPNCVTSNDVMAPPMCPRPGMAAYGFHAMAASLSISDTPIGYVPPVGPAVNFTVFYNQIEALDDFGARNLGPEWRHNWASWGYMVTSSVLRVALRGGGSEDFSVSMLAGTWATSMNPKSRSYLVVYRDSLNTFSLPNSITRNLPDGSKEVYDLRVYNSVFIPAIPVRLYLTKVIDPQGNEVNLSYTFNHRLEKITDAVGRETVFEYDGDNIVRVTDPFEREANFSYDVFGRLNGITDVVGITSSFTYGSGNFVSSLTTPYGTTQFSYQLIPNGRILTATDPLGRTEKLEQNLDLSGRQSTTYPSDQLVPSSIAVSGSNVSFLVTNNYLQYRNSFYWDKRAYAEDPFDYAKTVQYHWLHTNANQLSPYLEAMKRPLESWTFFNYPGQSQSYYEPSSTFVGKPSKVAQVMDVVSGTKKVALTQTAYNVSGQPTLIIDPLGRETLMGYSGENLNLVQQRNASGTLDTLFTSTYNGQRLPTSVTGADGKTARFGWSVSGLVTSSTNALGEVTAYDYDGEGYLESIDPPLSGTGDQITFTRDSCKRVRTATQWGYTLTYDYDELDRVTQVTYPDGTTEEAIYEAMHVRWTKDRIGRWTRMDVDAVQQVVGVLDPASQYTAFEWCKCGSLAAIIDPMGRVTRWGLDLQGRQTSKVYADGRTDTYAYNAYSGWLESATDAAGQTTKAEYALDGRMTATRYLNETISTPDVVLTWDAKYPRVTSMVDGTGTTAYTYRASGTNGGGAVATIDGPMGSDTITMAYDDLGRVSSRTIGSTVQSVTYDALGRLATVTNPLDTFTVGYDSASLPVTVTGTNGLGITNTFSGTTGDYRLSGSTYTWSGSQTLATFGYQYDAVGRITQWDHQVGAADPRRILPGYDQISQMTSAVIKNPGTSATISAEAYRYDRMGNRLGLQQGTEFTHGVFNNVNQLTSLSAGGEAVIQGQLNEPGTVTVGSKTVRTDGQNKFALSVPVMTGTNAFSVVSEDVNGNTSTNMATFTVATSGTRTFNYDLNGNTTSDGEKSYSWDGANRLVKITYSGTQNYTQFAYDGMSRTVRITEVSSGTTASDRRLLWSGLSIAELREANGTTVNRRYFSQGFQQSGTGSPENYFYVTDHLGSVRQIVDSSGVERGRWSYDLWGSRGLNKTTINPVESDFGYTGHYQHGVSELAMAPLRFYDPAVGRWVSRDPIREAAGFNLYKYVENNPLNLYDPLGLRVHINLLPPGPLRDAYNALFFNPPGVFSIAAHGSDLNLMPVKDLADKIRKHPDFIKNPRMPIQIFACNNGVDFPILAQALANELSVDVIVPNGWVTSTDPLEGGYRIWGPNPWVNDSPAGMTDFPSVSKPPWLSPIKPIKP